MKPVNDQVNKQVWWQVYRQFGADQVKRRVYWQVEDQVWWPVYRHVNGQVKGQVKEDIT